VIKLKDLLNEEGIVSNPTLVARHKLSIPVRDTISYLTANGGNVLFLTTSTRYPFNTGYNKGGVDIELPKSTELALYIKENIPNKSMWIDVPQLKILPCEGNVSHKDGNHCGVASATLKDKKKNPTGNHRCWASINDTSDELWKISKAIFEADTVLFFTSVRWGQTNSIYQKLIERLTWIQNRHETLKDVNVIEGKKAGFICIGQNYGGAEITWLQNKVLSYYGFDTPDNLFWNWQYTDDESDDTAESYKLADKQFHLDLGIPHIKIEGKK
jgi:multimeric flavodoxin WrbA